MPLLSSSQWFFKTHNASNPLTLHIPIISLLLQPLFQRLFKFPLLKKKSLILTLCLLQQLSTLILLPSCEVSNGLLLSLPPPCYPPPQPSVLWFWTRAQSLDCPALSRAWVSLAGPPPVTLNSLRVLQHALFLPPHLPRHPAPSSRPGNHRRSSRGSTLSVPLPLHPAPEGGWKHPLSPLHSVTSCPWNTYVSALAHSP